MKKAIKGVLALVMVCGIYTSHIVRMENCVDVSANKIELCSSEENILQTKAKSAYLMDFSTEKVLYSYQEGKHLPIASMCKIMTLLLSFDAIKEGALDMEEEVVVSERAASMGGSQVFLEANARYKVKELLKSIVVCSANDSCVALAERICGSEALFVDRMNEKAKEIGAFDTLFSNCTGLPKEPQYSCAKDVAIMLKNLLKHEEYYQFGGVWMDKFMHPGGRYTEISNTNKLVRFYDGCDGGKTGFTNEAGFCLAATAKRDNLRIISVVIGEENSKNRFDDVRCMFDYAFANYTATPILEKGKLIDEKAGIRGGKAHSVSVYPERSIYTLLKRGNQENAEVEITYFDKKAPIEKGEVLGEAIIYCDGIETERVNLLAAEAVKRANFFDRMHEIAEEWNR